MSENENITSSGRIECPVPKLDGKFDHTIDYSLALRITRSQHDFLIPRIFVICPMLLKLKKCQLTEKDCPIASQLSPI